MIRNARIEIFFLIAILGFISIFPELSRTQSSVSFCDGENLFIVNEGDCNGGLNFGARKPDCVCISGVYRSWAEDCSLYDGFTDKYCSPLWEQAGGYNVHGLRLLSGLSDINRDTMAVFGENGSDFTSMKTVGMGNNGKTWSNTFYTLNGFPVVLRKANDKFICVEPVQKSEKQVCRYFASDNPDLWEQGEGVRILLMDNCEVEGYTMTEMKEHRCYDVMNGNVSECHLKCETGKATYIPGSLPPREKKSVDGSKSENGASTNETSSGGGDHSGTSNANFFMHRKLNKYTRLRQSGQLEKPDLWQDSPNRTFSLLDTAKRIVRLFCPNDILSDLFLDQALELFVVLHRGEDYRYFEDVSHRDFEWIQEILLKCRLERSTVNEVNGFRTERRQGGCEKDDYVGIYQILVQDILRQLPLKKGDDHIKGKYHYVIEAVWQIIDMTHALCYNHFRKSWRMFHVWEQASEKLFTRDIRNLWFNPQIDPTVYKALLSNRAMVDMVNLERCTEAAYQIRSMPQLTRPSAPKSNFRRKRDVWDTHASVANSVDVFCAKENDDVEYNCRK